MTTRIGILTDGGDCPGLNAVIPAVACATDALDRLHTAAESHDRVMVLEAMGRYAGWIAIYSGIAGIADVILIPEIPFGDEKVCAKVEERGRVGRKFTIVAVAEGALPKGGDFTTTEPQAERREARLGGVGVRVASEIEKRTGKETRAVVLGHLQRGGSSTNMDRALCTAFGTQAVRMIADDEFGRIASYSGTQITSAPLADAVGRLRTVPLEGGFVRTARDLGICLGD